MGPESLYRKLQQHLDRMPVGFPATKSGVEIRILQRLFTSEEAGIALELSAVPEPAAAIRKRFKPKLGLAELTDALERMAARGLILRISTEAGPRYGKLILAVGIYERQVKRLTAEFESDVREYMGEAFGEALHTGKTTQVRTVPVNRTVAVARSLSTYDDSRAYVQSCAGPFGVMPCICRRGKDLLGDPCRQTSLRENCLMIGPAAD